jgi:WD40 repeat protein
VGFFSYSREDDEDSGGKLSKLRERIQAELRGQLGRTKKDFRLWQDQAAIAHGTMWEDEIKSAIAESVFFIPIITPTTVRSHHCKFEFDAFLAREKELGRSNLVFPILYIPVPALTGDRWRENPLLAIIGSRQYEQWQNLRHLDPSSTEVALRVEKFCANICRALQQEWLSPEELQQAEARRVAENERRRQEELQQAEARRREDEGRNQRSEAKQDAERARGSAEPVMGLVRTLTGHQQTISRLAVAPDGKTLASGCSRIIFDPELWIWDLGRGEVRTKLAGHTTSVWGLAFSPDGTIVASGATDQTLRLWSVPDGKCLHTFNIGNFTVLSLVFSPDGATLAAGTNEPSVRLWRREDGRLLRFFEDHENAVTGLAFSPDGTLLASASNNRVRIWRVHDWDSPPVGEEIQRQAEPKAFSAVAFSSDGALFAAGAHLWRVLDWKHVRSLQTRLVIGDASIDVRQVDGAAFSPDNAILAIRFHSAAGLWRVADGQFLGLLASPLPLVQDLAWLPDGSLITAAQKTIQLWSWSR